MKSNAGFETIEVEATTEPLLFSRPPHLSPEASTSKFRDTALGHSRKSSNHPHTGISHRDSHLSAPWNPSRESHHHVTPGGGGGGGMTTVDHLQLTAPSRKASVASGSILRGSVKSTTTMNSAYAGKKGWLAWAMEIRSREKQRIENLKRVQRQKEMKAVPEPIRKARYESCQLFPDPERRKQDYLPLKAVSKKKLTKKAKKKLVRSRSDMAKKFTDQDWHYLYAFWEHRIFTIFRVLGVILSALALIGCLPVLLNTHWVRHPYEVNVTIDEYNVSYYSSYDSVTDYPGTYFYSYDCQNTTCYYSEREWETHGLWFNCSFNMSTFTGLNDPACKKLQFDENYKFHPIVVGSLCCAPGLGFISLILNILGFVRLRLSDRIYSFHSAGELYVLSGGLFSLGLSVMVATDDMIYHNDAMKREEPKLLPGFYIAWVIPLFYFTAGFFLMFDDIIRFFFRTRTKSPSNLAELYQMMLPNNSMYSAAGGASREMKYINAISSNYITQQDTTKISETTA